MSHPGYAFADCGHHPPEQRARDVVHPLLAVHVQHLHSPLFHVRLYVHCQPDRFLSIEKPAVVAWPENIAWLHTVCFAAKCIT